jgi:hypothetical protein
MAPFVGYSTTLASTVTGCNPLKQEDGMTNVIEQAETEHEVELAQSRKIKIEHVPDEEPVLTSIDAAAFKYEVSLIDVHRTAVDADNGAGSRAHCGE